MKIILSLEIKRTPEPKKKSPTKPKPTPSDSKPINIIIQK